uniref:Uncharacterized protein n=1 Tax=Eutreptiella gymnastica TaxID=73025 RepID=A0A7S4GQB0_9EUGL
MPNRFSRTTSAATLVVAKATHEDSGGPRGMRFVWDGITYGPRDSPPASAQGAPRLQPLGEGRGHGKHQDKVADTGSSRLACHQLSGYGVEALGRPM